MVFDNDAFEREVELHDKLFHLEMDIEKVNKHVSDIEKKINEKQKQKIKQKRFGRSPKTADRSFTYN